jgi:histidinol dehydrogenase
MEVCREIEIRGKRLERRDIALKSVERRGCVGVVDNLQDAFSLANKFGPEHISLSVEDPWEYLDKIRNVGAIFVGDLSHEVLGDYVAGPSHVMPTGGSARFGSGLNVRSFLKISPIIGLDDDSSLALGRAASTIGRAEGLTGHAEAAEIREELQRDLS